MTNCISSIFLVVSVFCSAQSKTKPANQGGQKSGAAAQVASKPPTKLERVHANPKGFELAPRPIGEATQIGGATRGMGPPTVLLAPYKGQSYTLNPLFQWINANGIATYMFRLFASDGSTVLYQSSVSGTSLKYPSNAVPLQPGGDYFWTVQPTVGFLSEGPEPAEIVIVGLRERAELGSQLPKYSANSLERAQFFVETKLWYDSIESYTELLKSKLDEPHVLELRGKLYDQLPQTKQAAEADFEQAKRSSPAH